MNRELTNKINDQQYTNQTFLLSNNILFKVLKIS